MHRLEDRMSFHRRLLAIIDRIAVGQLLPDEIGRMAADDIHPLVPDVGNILFIQPERRTELRSGQSVQSIIDRLHNLIIPHKKSAVWRLILFYGDDLHEVGRTLAGRIAGRQDDLGTRLDAV